MAKKRRVTVRIADIRTAIANYMRSEGCTCCRDNEKHDEHTKRIAELLNVPPYDDDSGYDFSPFQTKK